MNNYILNYRAIPQSEHHITNELIAPNALFVVQTLIDNGFETYLVGGCVRDLYLHKQPKDFDVTTSATPEQVVALFNKPFIAQQYLKYNLNSKKFVQRPTARVIGKRFKIAHVTFGDEIIEVATFRAAENTPIIQRENEEDSNNITNQELDFDNENNQDVAINSEEASPIENNERDNPMEASTIENNQEDKLTETLSEQEFLSRRLQNAISCNKVSVNLNLDIYDQLRPLTISPTTIIPTNYTLSYVHEMIDSFKKEVEIITTETQESFIHVKKNPPLASDDEYASLLYKAIILSVYTNLPLSPDTIKKIEGYRYFKNFNLKSLFTLLSIGFGDSTYRINLFLELVKFGLIRRGKIAQPLGFILCSKKIKTNKQKKKIAQNAENFILDFLASPLATNQYTETTKLYAFYAICYWPVFKEEFTKHFFSFNLLLSLRKLNTSHATPEEIIAIGNKITRSINIDMQSIYPPLAKQCFIKDETDKRGKFILFSFNPNEDIHAQFKRALFIFKILFQSILYRDILNSHHYKPLYERISIIYLLFFKIAIQEIDENTAINPIAEQLQFGTFLEYISEKEPVFAEVYNNYQAYKNKAFELYDEQISNITTKAQQEKEAKAKAQQEMPAKSQVQKKQNERAFIDKLNKVKSQQSRISNNAGLLIRDNNYGTLIEDVTRRDLTINALYYDISSHHILDFHHGIEAINNKLIEIIGDPITRYKEDPVRMLRAIRFSAKLDMEITERTADPIYKNGELLRSTSNFRMYDELGKMFLLGYGEKTFALMRKFKTTKYIFPALDNLLNATNQPMGKYANDFITNFFRHTDERIANGKTGNLCFMYSALLWPNIYEKFNQYYVKLDILSLINEITFKPNTKFKEEDLAKYKQILQLIPENTLCKRLKPSTYAKILELDYLSTKQITEIKKACSAMLKEIKRAFLSVTEAVTHAQDKYTAFPWFTLSDMNQIWITQLFFYSYKDPNSRKILNFGRFKAALDFLEYRAELDPTLKDLFDYWNKIYQKSLR